MEIDKLKVEKLCANLSEVGVEPDSERKLVVSLTSFPERMYETHLALYSLLTQSIKPNKLILWLCKEEFTRSDMIPESVLKLQDHGLEIKWCRFLRQYGKYIPALEAFPDYNIITVDDDVYYKSNMVKLLYDDYKKANFKKMVYASRAHRIRVNSDGTICGYSQWIKAKDNALDCSFLNFPTGVGGVLFPPNTLHEDVLNEDLFLKLSPKNDDIYFWAMAVINDVMIKSVRQTSSYIPLCVERTLGYNGQRSLYHENVYGGLNNIYMDNLIEHYPDLLVKIYVSSRKI